MRRFTIACIWRKATSVNIYLDQNALINIEKELIGKKSGQIYRSDSQSAEKKEVHISCNIDSLCRALFYVNNLELHAQLLK